MATHFVQIMLLAAVSDGKIDGEEEQLIRTYRNLYPPIRDISEAEFKNELVMLNNRLHAGMKLNHIVEDIGDNLNEKQKNIAYALAVEMCFCNFFLRPEEKVLLETIETQWKIKQTVVSALRRSAQLRYEKNPDY